ncbi:MAG: HAD family phosphatase [Polaromonas sp.]|uniref:HAD family hydrolase n=1 Tax=Polaromonas sp. TaxID=1869339 RepID=UPI00273317D8|nr:HAD family phosphatase [Polaromonas sp.]MDP2818723.1 HAD family phosphatase [Polaromonas sp.]
MNQELSRLEQVPAVKALLFDLGGVLIDIDFNRAFEHWQTFSALSLEGIRAAFRFDDAYGKHERGEIDATEYFAHLVKKLQLRDDPEGIAQGWNAIFTGEITETLALVQAVRTHLPCYAFSNSNAVHQAAWSRMYPAVVQAFDRIFVSSDIGLRKPERRAFEHIADAIKVPAPAMLFFDDLAENVAGARAAGLQAVHVRSPADVRAALAAHGCVPQPPSVSP